MIKVNLMPKGKRTSGFSALGVDISKVNIKFVLIAIAVSYGSKIPLSLYTKGAIKDREEEIANVSKQKKVLSDKISKYKEVEKNIQEIVEQEKKLRERKEVIEARMQNKKNPVRVMIYISKNVPDNLWIQSMNIKGDTINIKGVTSTYKSIGDFIENLKNSVYFDKEIKFSGAQTNIDKETGRRTESFELSGKILRYN